MRKIWRKWRIKYIPETELTRTWALHLTNCSLLNSPTSVAFCFFIDFFKRHYITADLDGINVSSCEKTWAWITLNCKVVQKSWTLKGRCFNIVICFSNAFSYYLLKKDKKKSNKTFSFHKNKIKNLGDRKALHFSYLWASFVTGTSISTSTINDKKRYWLL